MKVYLVTTDDGDCEIPKGVYSNIELAREAASYADDIYEVELDAGTTVPIVYLPRPVMHWWDQ